MDTPLLEDATRRGMAWIPACTTPTTDILYRSSTSCFESQANCIIERSGLHSYDQDVGARILSSPDDHCMFSVISSPDDHCILSVTIDRLLASLCHRSSHKALVSPCNTVTAASNYQGNSSSYQQHEGGTNHQEWIYHSINVEFVLHSDDLATRSSLFVCTVDTADALPISSPI